MFWDGRVEVLDPVGRVFRSPLGQLLPTGLDNVMAVQALFPLARIDEMLGASGDFSPPDLPPPHAQQENELAGDTKGLDGPRRIKKVVELVVNRLVGTELTPTQPWQLTYRKLFRAAYPDIDYDEITIVHMANALSHFEEIAFATRETPWDKYVDGDSAAITLDAKRGAFLFFGKARCAVCHSGPLFSDFKFHSVGVDNFGPGINNSGDDQGRYLITKDARDRYTFRTPPLRNVTLSAPYFHNGSASTLHEAIHQHLDPLNHADQYEDTGVFAMSLDQIEAVSTFW